MLCATVGFCGNTWVSIFWLHHQWSLTVIRVFMSNSAVLIITTQVCVCDHYILFSVLFSYFCFCSQQPAHIACLASTAQKNSVFWFGRSSNSFSSHSSSGAIALFLVPLNYQHANWEEDKPRLWKMGPCPAVLSQREMTGSLRRGFLEEPKSPCTASAQNRYSHSPRPRHRTNGSPITRYEYSIRQELTFSRARQEQLPHSLSSPVFLHLIFLFLLLLHWRGGSNTKLLIWSHQRPLLQNATADRKSFFSKG